MSYNSPDKYVHADGTPTPLWRSFNERLIVVLNDGNTFTEIGGCKIVSVPNHLETDEIEEVLDGNSEIKPTVLVHNMAKICIPGYDRERTTPDPFFLPG